MYLESNKMQLILYNITINIYLIVRIYFGYSWSRYDENGLLFKLITYSLLPSSQRIFLL